MQFYQILTGGNSFLFASGYRREPLFSTTINIALQEIYNLCPFQVVNASLFFFPNKKTINLKKQEHFHFTIPLNESWTTARDYINTPVFSFIGLSI